MKPVAENPDERSRVKQNVFFAGKVRRMGSQMVELQCSMVASMYLHVGSGWTGRAREGEYETGEPVKKT